MARLLAAAVALASLAAVAKCESSIEPTVTAFYYLWYGSPEVDGEYKHWNHKVLPHWAEAVRSRYPADVEFMPPEDIHAPYYPEAGCYSSRDPKVLRSHMKQMKEAGIQVAAVSWWGRPDVPGTHDTQGVTTDSLIPAVLEAAAAEGMQVAFHMEPYHGRSAASFAEDVKYIAEKYGAHAAVHKLRGRIVYYVYDSYHISAADWQHILQPHQPESLRGTPADGFFIGLWLEYAHGHELLMAGFDAGYTYFSSDGFTYGSSTHNWPTMTQWARSYGMPLILCVGPGYDDRRIRPWNAANTKPREHGAYYDRMWQAALDAGADAVAITSFNEWGEGTQIEPAVAKTIPEDVGIPDHFREQLSLTREYEDYEPEGPKLYLSKTLEWSQKFHAAAATAAAEAAGAAASNAEL